MVVHFKHHCNTYGSLSAYIVAFVVRLSGGEPLLGLNALIRYPGYDEENQQQLFPFRTMAMLLSLLTLYSVSAYTKYIFETGRLAPQYDYFKCVVNIPDDVVRVGDPSEVGEQVSTLNLGTQHSHSHSLTAGNGFSLQLHVMSGPMAKIYGAATMAGKDEMNGRINPAMEADDDMPASEIERNRQIVADVKKRVASLPQNQGNTNF